MMAVDRFGIFGSKSSAALCLRGHTRCILPQLPEGGHTRLRCPWRLKSEGYHTRCTFRCWCRSTAPKLGAMMSRSAKGCSVWTCGEEGIQTEPWSPRPQRTRGSSTLYASACGNTPYPVSAVLEKVDAVSVGQNPVLVLPATPAQEYLTC